VFARAAHLGTLYGLAFTEISKWRREYWDVAHRKLGGQQLSSDKSAGRFDTPVLGRVGGPTQRADGDERVS